jgi:hypothetical protein
VPFPTHLKIDVDGTELSVLKGSRKTLRDPRLREVQVEVVDFTSEEATSRAVIELMAAIDMCRFDVFPHNAAYPRARDLRFYR